MIAPCFLKGARRSILAEFKTSKTVSPAAQTEEMRQMNEHKQAGSEGGMKGGREEGKEGEIKRGTRTCSQHLCGRSATYWALLGGLHNFRGAATTHANMPTRHKQMRLHVDVTISMSKIGYFEDEFVETRKYLTSHPL